MIGFTVARLTTFVAAFTAVVGCSSYDSSGGTPAQLATSPGAQFLNSPPVSTQSTRDINGHQESNHPVSVV